MRVELVHDVPAPLTSVFDAVSDITLRPSWVGIARERSPLDDQRSGEGARFRAVDQLPGRTIEYIQTIDRLEPDRLLEESWDGPMAGRSRIRFSGDDGVTTLSVDAEVASPLPGFLSFLEPLARHWAEHTFRQDLARLNDLVA